MRKLCTILAALTLVVLCFVLMPAEAEAAEFIASGSCGENANWFLDDEGTLTITGTGTMNDYFSFCPVCGKMQGHVPPWDKHASFIKCVVIEDGITYIGRNSFYNCVNLTSVTIPSSVIGIGDAAFDDCTNLTGVYITDIAAWCAIEFWDFDSNPMCQAETLYLNEVPVTDLRIPNYVTEIKAFTFYSCESLTNITIPNTVNAIGERAFAACTGLNSITVHENNAYYCSDSQGVLYNKEETVLIQAPGAITTCVIPDGVTSVGAYAFRSCKSLRTVTIPASVTTIGGYAFNYCHGLKGVYISDLTAWCKISFGSFSANPLNYGNILYVEGVATTQLILPECITEVKNFAFFNCKSLTKVVIPEGVTQIGEKAFYNCANLAQVAIPSSARNICAEAFYNTSNLEKVIFCETDVLWKTIDIHSSNTYLINAPRDHDWVKYSCAICSAERVDEKLVFMGSPGISFQDYIGMQVMLKNSVAKDYDDFYVEISQVTPNGVVTNISYGNAYNASYKYFEQKIVSWSMTEQVTMTLCGEKDGKVYKGVSFTTSVMELAMEKLLMYEFEGDLARCKALVDMLNYGAAVQMAYDYNVANLPNADLGVFAEYGTTETPAFEGTNDITGTNQIKVYSANISLQDKVEFQFLVKTSALKDRTVVATLNGTAVDVVYQEYNSYTIIRVAAAAAHMRDTYTIVVNDANGNPVTCTYNVSVEAYAKEQLNTDRAVALVAMMKYGDAVSKI